MAGFCEADEFADFVLRVKTAVELARFGVPAERDFRFAPIPFAVGFVDAPRPDLREARIFFDFDAPAGTVRQVKMQAVKFVKRHRVDELFDFFDGEKMAGNVQVQTAPTHCGCVFDAQERERIPVVVFQLFQRFFRVKLSGFRRVGNNNFLR